MGRPLASMERMGQRVGGRERGEEEWTVVVRETECEKKRGRERGMDRGQEGGSGQGRDRRWEVQIL